MLLFEYYMSNICLYSGYHLLFFNGLTMLQNHIEYINYVFISTILLYNAFRYCTPLMIVQLIL